MHFILGACVLLSLSILASPVSALSCDSVPNCSLCTADPTVCGLCETGYELSSDAKSCYIRTRGYYKIARQRKDIYTISYSSTKADVSYYFGLITFYFLKVLSFISKLLMYHIHTMPSFLLDHTDAGLNYLNYLAPPAQLYSSMLLHPYIRTSFFPPYLPPPVFDDLPMSPCTPPSHFLAAGLHCNYLYNYGQKIIILAIIALGGIVISVLAARRVKRVPSSDTAKRVGTVYGIGFLPVMMLATGNELFGVSLVGLSGFGGTGADVAGGVLSLVSIVGYAVLVCLMMLYSYLVYKASQELDARKNLPSSKLRDLEVSENKKLKRDSLDKGSIASKEHDGTVKHVPEEAGLEPSHTDEIDDKKSLDVQDGSVQGEIDDIGLSSRITKSKLHWFFQTTIDGIKVEKLSTIYVFIPLFILVKSIVVQLVVYFLSARAESQLLLVGTLEAISALLIGVSALYTSRIVNILMTSNAVLYSAYAFLRYAAILTTDWRYGREDGVGAALTVVAAVLMASNTVYVLYLVLEYIVKIFRDRLSEWKENRLKNKVTPGMYNGGTTVTEGQEINEKKIEQSEVVADGNIFNSEANLAPPVEANNKSGVVMNNSSYGTEKFPQQNVSVV